MRALFVTVRMKPEYRDQILKGALEDGRGSREDEPGCLRFDVIQDDSDPNTIYFYEVYRDDAALEAHRAAPHYPAWGNLPADWFVGQKAVVDPRQDDRALGGQVSTSAPRRPRSAHLRSRPTEARSRSK